MKKSNIFLIIAFCLAFCWTVLFGWFGASAINNYLHGKDPYYARSHRQFLESNKKTFPAPVKELVISGESAAVLTIQQGKELTVESNPRAWDCICKDMGNGRSMISLKQLRDYNDPVTIMIPAIPSLSLDNFSEVTVKGLNQKEIHLQCKRVHSFTFVNCTIGILSLDFPRTRDQQDICINKSNQIDTLITSVQGSGKIRLEAVGQFKNQIFLSDSINIEATYDLMKKIRP